MTAKKRPSQRPLPPMPLSELPMMKALLAMADPLPGAKPSRNLAIGGSPTAELTTLRLTIIDKLQILALRRPRALLIVAQMVDRLLDRQLAVLDQHPNSEHVDDQARHAGKRRAAPGKRVAKTALRASNRKSRESSKSVHSK
jgi:hypothetical protein